MSLEISERNFLEKIADFIPGVSGYRAKEKRRDTDKRLREYMAVHLESSRKATNNAKLAFLKSGKMALLDELGTLERKMQKVADNIRYSSYGYSGFFDQMKIREEELDRLYGFDLALLSEIEAMVDRISGISSLETEDQVNELIGQMDALDTKVRERHQLFDRPMND